MSEFIGTVVVKEKPVLRLWVHNSCGTRVVPLRIKHPLLAIERSLSGMKTGMGDSRPQHSAEAEGRVGAEISTIHIGIRRVGAVVYLV